MYDSILKSSPLYNGTIGLLAGKTWVCVTDASGAPPDWLDKVIKAPGIPLKISDEARRRWGIALHRVRYNHLKSFRPMLDNGLFKIPSQPRLPPELEHLRKVCERAEKAAKRARERFEQEARRMGSPDYFSKFQERSGRCSKS